MSKIDEWAKFVIERDAKCVICSSKDGLEAHHVFHVGPYDESYHDTNNGVCLCRGCHDKYHRLYGVDCSITNLLDLQKKVGDKNVKKLKKENKRLKRAIDVCRKRTVGDSDD